MFRLQKTTFGPLKESAGDSTEKFLREVKNKTVSYVAYFPAWNDKVFMLEIVAGEQHEGEVYEEGDVEAYLTLASEGKVSATHLVDGLNKALFVLKEFSKQYSPTTIRFSSFNKKIDLMVERFIDSEAFSGEKKMKQTTRVFESTVMSRLLEKKDEDADDINKPSGGKLVTSPDKFDFGQHISHFDALSKGLDKNTNVIKLGLGRLNDDGGDYDTITLSGEETKVDVTDGISVNQVAPLKTLMRTARVT